MPNLAFAGQSSRENCPHPVYLASSCLNFFATGCHGWIASPPFGPLNGLCHGDRDVHQLYYFYVTSSHEDWQYICAYSASPTHGSADPSTNMTPRRRHNRSRRLEFQTHANVGATINPLHASVQPTPQSQTQTLVFSSGEQGAWEARGQVRHRGAPPRRAILHLDTPRHWPSSGTGLGASGVRSVSHQHV